MKTAKIFVLGSMMVILMGLAGCRTMPVENVSNSPIHAPKASLEEIKKTILIAGAGLGWKMREVRPGHIVGTLLLRKHMAKVDIPYNRNSYSINYKDSSELKYDGTTIHKNYNSWVHNLDRAIQNGLATL